MKEFIEKLIGRLEKAKERANRHYNYGDETAYRHSIEIVNQLAEEYNNGWIPCSQRLPEKNQRCLIQYNCSMTGYKDYIDVDIYNGERFEFFGITGVVAWQPLPEAYKEGSE